MGTGGICGLLVFKHVDDDSLCVKVSEHDFLVNELEFDDFFVHLKEYFFQFLIRVMFWSQLFLD